MRSPYFKRSLHMTLIGTLWVGFVSLTLWALRERIIRSRKPQELAAQSSLALPSVPASSPANQQNTSRKKRVFVLAAALLVVAVLLGALFTVRTYWSGTSHTGTNAGSSPDTSIARPDFERGIVYPRWSPDAYGNVDRNWQKGLQAAKSEAASQWIEIPVLFSQNTSHSTQVGSSLSTASVDSFVQGIRTAHALGYKVFFVPLMHVNEPGGWSGSIQFSSAQDEQTWFDSYWHMLQPYAQAAAANNVEQMAMGTELQWLQQYVPDSTWNQLITRVSSTFKGTLTYDMNWSSLDQTPRAWLKNPALTFIGVSTYIPLSTTATPVDPQTIPTLWHDKIRVKLDALSQQINKKILITEIGYRNSTDALYRTWEATSSAPTDPQLQATAYNAALSNAFSDPRIAGTFFWGWDDVNRFSINGQPAVQVLNTWYTRP